MSLRSRKRRPDDGRFVRSTRALACLAVLTGTAAFAPARILVVHGDDIGESENNAALTLAEDLRRRAPAEEVLVRPVAEMPVWSGFDHVVVVGTCASQSLFADARLRTAGLDEAPLASEAYVVQVFQNADPGMPGLVAIRGADVRAVHYGVSHFATVLLDTDPLAYWTGREVVPVDRVELAAYTHRAAPPAFKLRGYFDNDNDLLANFRGRKLIVEFELWKELIDSLVRLGYNYVDIHDLLGRPEYYLRDYYIAMTDYHTDLALVEKVIDYAHLKGLLVQIPMYLGWEFEHLDREEVCLSRHFDRWMEIYDHYLNRSPLGKGDLFLARPRDPIYDWPYRCESEEAAGIRPGPLFTRIFNELESRIRARNPAGQLVCDLWMEGLPMWRSGEFAPRRDVTMMWADNGFADFPEGWPDDFRGHAFGVYLHAGVWKNQVVQDPYPEAIGAALAEAARRGMTANLLVNGQNFKGFLLNLEAAARAAWDPAGFDPRAFYVEWATRYFGSAAARDVVRSLQSLHAAHAGVAGFRDVMKDSVQMLARIRKGEPTFHDPVPAQTALAHAKNALAAADLAAERIRQGTELTFSDQVRFPIGIYRQNLHFNIAMTVANNAFVAGASLSGRRAAVEGAVAELRRLRALLESGSGWGKWEGWYDPANFRIHTPPPTLAELEALLEEVPAS